MKEERVSIPGSGVERKDTENQRGSWHSSEGRRTSEKKGEDGKMVPGPWSESREEVDDRPGRGKGNTEKRRE